jgi:hypothetical protein
MSEAVRQRYKLATGKGLDSAPKGKSPGAAKGGAVRKSTGGAVYGKGGKASKKR